MLNYETRKKLELMQYEDLRIMFELLEEEKDKKMLLIDYFCNTCNNDELMQKLAEI